MSEFIYLEGMVMVRSMEGEIKVKIKMRNSAQLHVIICHTCLSLNATLPTDSFSSLLVGPGCQLCLCPSGLITRLSLIYSNFYLFQSVAAHHAHKSLFTYVKEKT